MKLNTELTMNTLNDALFQADCGGLEKHHVTNLIRAAALMVLDPRHKAYLVQNDQQALRQIISAINDAAGEYTI